ncbi:MAG: hypothetical protein AAB427_03550 [Chloroflexota bacterium]
MLSRVNTRQWWLIAILALTLMRLGMWWLILHDVPHVRDHADWYFYQGSDHALFFQMAQSIANNQPIASSVGAGLPLVMSLFIRMTNATVYDDILPMIVIWNGIFLGVASVPVMAALALALTGKRAQAFCVAAVWTLLPYLLWVGFAIHPEAEGLRNAYVPRQLWMTGLSDGPSLFFVALGMLLALWGLRKQTPIQYALFLLSGLCMGFAATIRIHVLPIAAVVVFALLWTRQWKSVWWIGVGMVIGFAPQFLYNSLSAGHALNTPYLSGWLIFGDEDMSGLTPYGWIAFGPDNHIALKPTALPFSPRSLLENLILVAGRLPLLTLAAVAAAATGLYAFIRMWRERGSFRAIVMFGAPVASFALHVTTFIFPTDPVRFTLPAVSIGLPALIFMVFIAAGYLKTILQKKGAA